MYTNTSHQNVHTTVLSLVIIFLPQKESITLIFLFVAVTHTSAKISNAFLFWVVVTNQLCSGNVLYHSLTGVAFMYTLRPLDNNPVEHTDLQYARRCSNTKHCLFFYLRFSISYSLSASLKVTSHHNGKQGLSNSIQINALNVCVSHMYSSRLKKAMIRNSGKCSHSCPWQWVTLHLTSWPAANHNSDLCWAFTRGQYSHLDHTHQTPSGSKQSWLEGQEKHD